LTDSELQLLRRGLGNGRRDDGTPYVDPDVRRRRHASMPMILPSSWLRALSLISNLLRLSHGFVPSPIAAESRVVA
jgi:hypothetical protein